MAARLVLLGYEGRCLELSPADAGALITSGMCRVSLSCWAGPLSDATVLMFRPEYLNAHGGESSPEAHHEAFERCLRLVADGNEFTVDQPIPLGARAGSPRRSSRR
jgi:hypothetical protein